jgi:hypothetical protein
MANIGKVTVKTGNRTTIASPNFEPKVNISIGDIQSVNVSTRQDGDTLIYNVLTDEYESAPLSQVQIDLKNINGGLF